MPQQASNQRSPNSGGSECLSAVAGFGKSSAGTTGRPGLLLHPLRLCWPKPGWTLNGTKPEPLQRCCTILCRTLLIWHRCREPPSLEVLRSVPILRHLLRQLRPSDLAALMGSCRTAATTVKQELQFHSAQPGADAARVGGQRGWWVLSVCTSGLHKASRSPAPAAASAWWPGKMLPA